jgi:AAA15 family ATPase/GTPase
MNMAKNKNYDSKREKMKLENLYLDPNNYRLINEPEYLEVPEEKIKDKLIARRTFRLLTGDKNQHIQDLIESFKTNNYLPVDQIQVRKISDDDYVVIEGNRRVAALKSLHAAFEERGIDLGQLTPEVFQNVPVVLYEDSDELHHLTLMALKHISGNKKWAEWNQAKLLENMYSSYELSENEICRRIGITKVALRKSLRALSFLKQYQDSDYGDQFTESLFAIFRETIGNANLKDWLDWDDGEYKATHKTNLEQFFSWLSKEPMELENADDQIEYGNEYYPPAIVKREDIRLLGKMIFDENAIKQLKKTRDINAAYRSSNLVFQERQEASVRTVMNEITTLAQMAIQPEYLPPLEDTLGRLQSIVEKAKASGFTGIEQKGVFHDRIGSHFTSLEIKKYKGLKEIKLNKLSRINLFAGINNSGKTTLLEAIYLLCRQNDFSGLMEVVRRRGKVAEDKLNPEWFTEQLSQELIISGLFDNSESEVSVRHYKEENSEIDKSRYLESVEITSVFGSYKQESLSRIFKGREHETQAGTIKMLCPSVFSSPFFLNEPHRYTSYYHKSFQSKALPKILEFIREKVVPTLDDIRLVDELQRFMVSDSSFEHAMDLTEYGEGLQRIFFISLLFASAQNGVILIDEFENAIHAGLISTFSEFIYDLAILFNVQVFLTSHSKECIDAFVNNIPDKNALSACALVEENNKINVREFSGKEFSRLVEAGNVDLRRAK